MEPYRHGSLLRRLPMLERWDDYPESVENRFHGDVAAWGANSWNLVWVNCHDSTLTVSCYCDHLYMCYSDDYTHAYIMCTCGHFHRYIGERGSGTVLGVKGILSHWHNLHSLKRSCRGQLHRLPVKFLIYFKICTITFKTLKYNQYACLAAEIFNTSISPSSGGSPGPV